MSTHNTCFHGEIQKISVLISCKSACLNFHSNPTLCLLHSKIVVCFHLKSCSNDSLSLTKVLTKLNCSRQHSNFFCIIFSVKTRLGISCELFVRCINM